MGKGALFSAFLQFGELDVDWIIANDVAVQIEDTLVADTTLLLDFIEGLGADGVFVEQVNFDDGSVTVPVDANIGNTGAIEGALLANGGIFADSVPDGDFSFTVEDNTGDTTIKGLLSVFGGINADNGKFTVASGTGETRIADALLRADGGIDVGNGLFTVNAQDGSFRTQSNANVDQDIFLGTAIAETRTLARVPSASANGGNTIIKGQDATSVGGGLVLSPGTGATVGKVILGRAAPDDLFVGRASLEDTATDGGRTVFQGQDSNSGVGGDLIVAAGDSTGNGQGGNLILSVGLSATGAPGQLILGTDIQADSDFDLTITRPELIGSLAGSTSLNGQSTNRGAGGDLWLNAGSVLSGTGTPGDLVLQPGSTPSNVVGSIFLGGPQAADLSVRRFPVAAAGGDTFFEGQTSLSGSGGDLFMRAGNAGNVGDAGNLWLEPGSTVGGQIGSIFWGQANDNLVISRPATDGSGTSTTINGQASTAGNGGALTLSAGTGNLLGGNLALNAGAGSAGVGGSIDLTAGTGSSFGGSILVAAGDGISGNGGDVTITAGSGAAAGGNIVISAGTGATGLGSVTVGPTAASFIVNAPSVVVNNGEFVLTNNGNTLAITPNPETILAYNGVQILRSRVASVAEVDEPVPNTCDISVIEQLQESFNSLLNALGPGPNGHGLIQVVGQNNLSPGAVPPPAVPVDNNGPPIIIINDGDFPDDFPLDLPQVR